MCGIAVAIDWDGAETIVQQLIAGLLHRGDITDPLVTLGNRTAMCTRRLRIVDPAHGIQPTASFDERLLVCFNGEIYNHVALRKELEAEGASFRSTCDTEVVANALRLWGTGAIKRLRGMFAFVAIDVATGAFVAARDPLGVKPLYLIESHDGILFCSEIRPLLNAIDYGRVLPLPPGHVLTRTSLDPYYLLPSPTSLGCGSTVELDRLLTEAVRVRIPDDQPVAMFFSGGIDSTLVIHYARRYCSSLPCYVVAGRGSPDALHARRYADATGLDLREVEITASDAALLPLCRTVVETLETFEPAVVRPSLYAYRLSECVHRDGFRVALCGEGADELFAGYEPLEAAFAKSERLGRYVQTQCLEMMHRANLQRVDRCSMRFQLEVREPFLDRTIVEYARGLDRSALVNYAAGVPIGKAPLRELYDVYPSLLPTFIRDRKKLLFHDGVRGEGHARWWENIFEEAVTDADFRDGRREYEDYNLATKEELFLLRALASSMDVARVPHLRARLHLDTLFDL